MEWSLKLKMKTRNTRGDYYYGMFRIPKLSFCLTTTMCMLFVLTKAGHCPAPCTCVYNTRTITCYNSQEIEVPTYLPPWVNAMIVRGNNITTLPEGGFSTNGTELQLFTLTLSKNNIQTIEAYAFVGLPLLETLDLSHNRLLSISVQAFYGLGELRFLFLNDSLLPTAALQVSTALTTGSLLNLNRLELSGNQLESIPFSNFDTLSLEALILINNSIQAISKENVSRLSEHKEISLYLAQNPFKCDCELESFYNWLKNSSQCPDVHLLVCSEPGNKKGILLEKLRKEDVDCVNAELEAVSYALLGIVLALIGVVFLMVLYLNREGIKRWLNNIRDACRDQMEVYHYRYEQDSDPRLANVAV